MTRNIPIRYLNEDTAFDAEVIHILPNSERMKKVNDYDAHIDDCYTIILITKGCGSMDVDFHTVHMSEGQLGVITPGQVHSNLCVEDCEFLMLRISPDMMESDYRSRIDDYSLTGKPIRLTEDTKTLLCDTMQLLSRLIASMGDTQSMKGVVFNMLSVILGIITPLILSGQPQRRLRTTEITVKFKQMLPQFIKQQKRPSFYANQLCISEVYLNEAVKKSTGMTPSEWIINAIMLEAKRLLRSTSLSIKEIAFELGYEDHTYFSRLFKKKTAMTPLIFRNTFLK